MCIAFALSSAAVPASAQSPPTPAQPPGVPKNADPPSESTTPPAYPGRESATPDKPLSNELKQNEGVLEPPKSLDNAIVREAPVPEPNTTPVIPPPGAPGGDTNVKPK